MSKIREIVEEIAESGVSDEIKAKYANVLKYRKAEQFVSELIIRDDIKLLSDCVQSGLVKICRFHLTVAARVSVQMLTTCFDLDPQLKININPDVSQAAASGGNLEILEYLKDIGAPFNWGPSMTALGQDNLTLFKWLETHFPNNIHYDYQYRSVRESFECFKYLYSKGYIPSYGHYKQALDTGDLEYAEWLKSIGCPGTYEIKDVPDDVQYRFEHHLNPGDFPWMKTLAETGSFPKLNQIYWSVPLLTVLDEFLTYLDDPILINYVFEYIGSDPETLNHLSMSDLFETLTQYDNNRQIELIKKLKLDPYFTAQLYDVYECEHGWVGEEENEVLDWLKSQVKWGTMFLVQLNGWIESEGSYQASEFVQKINELWDIYEDQIPELQDEQNKKEWEKLTGDPWKIDMHDFLYKLGIW